MRNQLTFAMCLVTILSGCAEEPDVLIGNEPDVIADAPADGDCSVTVVNEGDVHEDVTVVNEGDTTIIVVQPPVTPEAPVEVPEAPEPETLGTVTVGIMNAVHGTGLVSVPVTYPSLVDTIQVTLPEGVERGTLSRLGVDLAVIGPQGASPAELDGCYVYSWPDYGNCVADLTGDEIPADGHLTFTFHEGCMIEQVQLIDFVCNAGPRMPVGTILDARIGAAAVANTAAFAEAGSWLEVSSMPESTAEGHAVKTVAALHVSQIQLPSTTLVSSNGLVVARIALAAIGGDVTVSAMHVNVVLAPTQGSDLRLGQYEQSSLRTTGEPSAHPGVSDNVASEDGCDDTGCNWIFLPVEGTVVVPQGTTRVIDVLMSVDGLREGDAATVHVTGVDTTEAGSYGLDYQFNLTR